MNLIKGKIIATEIAKKTKERASQLAKKNMQPKLAVLLIGDDKPSHTYVRTKERAAKLAGIDFSLTELPSNSSKEDIIKSIQNIQLDKTVTGVIAQLPLPNREWENDVVNTIRPDIDVDCLTDTNLGKLVAETNIIVPPTPGAVMDILESLDIDPVGKHVVIVGTGTLVGKPFAIMMMNRQATVVTCNFYTKNLKELCKEADILVSAVGKKNLITKGMVKKGAVVIDAGVNFDKGVMFGDVDVKNVAKRASYVTPTPGGVGPLTVARLLENTVALTEIKCTN
jgi:methylenetetrahydrofolate dehydrogenase (NADP+) / methenyltetrahydrofolate cyclohydrolase